MLNYSNTKISKSQVILVKKLLFFDNYVKLIYDLYFEGYIIAILNMHIFFVFVTVNLFFIGNMRILQDEKN